MCFGKIFQWIRTITASFAWHSWTFKAFGHQGEVLIFRLARLPFFLQRNMFLSCSVMSDSFANPWNVAHQAPLSTGFLRQENWVGCHFPLQGIFRTQGIKSRLLHYRRILYCRASRKARRKYSFTQNRGHQPSQQSLSLITHRILQLKRS